MADQVQGRNDLSEKKKSHQPRKGKKHSYLDRKERKTSRLDRADPNYKKKKDKD